MSTDSHPTPDDGEHHVVSTVAFVALVDIVDALNGVAQIASNGKLGEGETPVGRGELAALFRVFGAHLNHQLQALPHRAGGAA